MSEQTDAFSSKTKTTIVSESPSLVSKNFDIFGSPDYNRKRDRSHTSAKRQLINDDYEMDDILEYDYISELIKG